MSDDEVSNGAAEIVCDEVSLTIRVTATTDKVVMSGVGEVV